MWRDTEYIFVFSPDAGKCGPEKTPYLDTSRSDSKMFIFGKVATSCTKGIAIIACRKFSEILKRITLQNSYHKIPVVKFVLIKLQGWILDLHFAQ